LGVAARPPKRRVRVFVAREFCVFGRPGASALSFRCIIMLLINYRRRPPTAKFDIIGYKRIFFVAEFLL
jgi:hypothetical protein